VADLVVITGAGGMGLAVARRLGPGRRLLLADYAADALAAAADALRAEGLDVETHPVDVGDAAAVATLATAARGLGDFTYLVHTAGVSPVQATPEQIVRVDVVGTALVLDAFEPDARPGCVAVCIASMAGTMIQVPVEDEQFLASTPAADLAGLPILDPAARDSGSAYAVAKRANQVRVQAAAVRWGRHGARVVSISPGVISTPMGRQELEGPVGEIMRQMVDTSPTGRLGTPADIAAAVAFLVSAEASFITGTDLLVDGGVVAAMLRSDTQP
jgi:NAD(P)-dependent dehydrogenase (short-subunit alcohol dehydrogenase family)